MYRIQKVGEVSFILICIKFVYECHNLQFLILNAYKRYNEDGSCSNVWGGTDSWFWNIVWFSIFEQC
jgi:hypothetical protein